MTSRGALAGLFILAMVLFGLLTPRRALASPAWGLLRCLWPSWRFFDVITPPPELRFRLREGDVFGAWHTVFAPARRSAFSMVLNAEGNLTLAYLTLCERLVEELDGKLCDEAPELTTYRLVQCLIESRLRAEAHVDIVYQFSLREADSDEELFVSRTHALRAAGSG